MPESFFLTTAIDYVNGRPHLGHAYEKVLADAMARYQRLTGRDVFFLTGTDEHGQKMQQSAAAAGKDPQAFCDEMSQHFRELCTRLGITHSRFVRTTAPDHKRQVREFLQQLYDKGEISFQEHRGYYSVRQEQFVTEKDKVDGAWPEIFGEVTEMVEPNYFFNLSKYQDWLRDFLTKEKPDWILPAFRRQDVLSALENPLPDLCISRPKARLAWGIPLPFDDTYVTYVWFDALLNYVTFADGNWPADRNWGADAQIIGKDILVPAHGVYWPIMLKALGLPLPKKLIVHGWWLSRGTKMSKSLGNVMNPIDYIDVYGPDAFRYFVLREMATGQDADFTHERFMVRYEADLANTLGNLVQRTVAMIGKYRAGTVPSYEAALVTAEDAELQRDNTIDNFNHNMERWQLHAALDHASGLATAANQYAERTAPWSLAKKAAAGDAAADARLNVVLAHLAETVRRLTVLLEPVIPHTTEKLRAAGFVSNATGTPLQLEDARFGQSLAGKKLEASAPLFPKIEESTV